MINIGLLGAKVLSKIFRSHEIVVDYYRRVWGGKDRKELFDLLLIINKRTAFD